MLKGVPLAKEGPQLIGIHSASADCHKLNVILDHVRSNLKEKCEYHSMLMRDKRHHIHKDRAYFAALAKGFEEEILF